MCIDKWPFNLDKTEDSIRCVVINSKCTQLAVGTNLGAVMTFDLLDMSRPVTETHPERSVSITALSWTADNYGFLCATSSGAIYKNS